MVGASVSGASGARASATGASVEVDAVTGGSVAGADSEDGGTSEVILTGELEGWADSEISGSGEACLVITVKLVAGITGDSVGVYSVSLAESEAGTLLDSSSSSDSPSESA